MLVSLVILSQMKAAQPRRQLCCKPNLNHVFSFLLAYITLTVQQPFFLENLADVHFITFRLPRISGRTSEHGKSETTLSGQDSPFSLLRGNFMDSLGEKIRPRLRFDHSYNRSHCSAFTNPQIFNIFRVYFSLLVILHTDFLFMTADTFLVLSSICFILLITFSFFV